MALVLGIDGGGTKTACAVSRDGQIVGEAVSGPSNLVRSPETVVRESVHSAVKTACERAGVAVAQIEAACFGLAGLSGANVPERMHAIGKEVLSCEVEIVGDSDVALEAAVKGGPGVVVIAGTGSIVLGRNAKGDYGRAGGWGSVISDEGSGFWIGRNAIANSFRALDAGVETSLMQHIMDAWSLTNPEQLIVKANAHPQPPFAELMPAVLKAANEGDKIAIELFTSGGVELARTAMAVVRKLWQPGEPATVYMVGGVFQNARWVREAFDRQIRSERAEVATALSTDAPVTGALFRAEQSLVSRR